MKINELRKSDHNFKSSVHAEEWHTKKRQCSKCGKKKLLKQFAKRNDRPGGTQSRCKVCFKAYSLKLTRKRQKGKRKEAYREYNRKYYYTPQGKAKAKRNNLSMYGLSLEQWENMLRKQKRRCAICRRIMRPPYTDHDHKRHVLRELLCGLCNCLLGFSKDDTRTLRRAIKYLIKHRRKACLRTR